MAGSWIEFRSDGQGSDRAYLAVPQAGSGPPVLLVPDGAAVSAHMRDTADLYAEEGYTVLAPDFRSAETDAADITTGVRDASAALDALLAVPAATGEAGALGFGRGGAVACLLAARANIACAIAYCPAGLDAVLDATKSASCPIVLHLAEQDRLVSEQARVGIGRAFVDRKDARLFLYPGCGHDFYAPETRDFDKPATLMAHSRSIALFRKVLGPHYDLSSLWDRHTELEFAARDRRGDHGHHGRRALCQPRPDHDRRRRLSRPAALLQTPFHPEDAGRTPSSCRSRAPSARPLVDEMLFCFTHDIEIDWMLPGVAPTGKYVEIPMIAIVRFRGDKLYNEHIYWDQASVLVQVGLLDPANLPVAGIETAKKLVDETLPSNTMMARWAESARRAAE